MANFTLDRAPRERHANVAASTREGIQWCDNPFGYNIHSKWAQYRVYYHGDYQCKVCTWCSLGLWPRGTKFKKIKK